MRVVALAVFMVLFAACTQPTMSGEPLAVANQHYEAGEYAQAVDAYQSLVDAGVTDGALFYNLGNAYFKSGDLGRAILNYRRAQRRLPRDPDVAANLQLARAQTKDRLEVEGDGGIVGFVEHLLVEWTTLDEAAAVALGLWGLFCVLVVIFIVLPRARRALSYGMVVVALLLALSVLSVGVRVLGERGKSPAVIVADSVEIRSGPGANYLTEFTLHTGAEVYVIEARAGWVRIALPGDLQGWVPEERVERVY